MSFRVYKSTGESLETFGGTSAGGDLTGSYPNPTLTTALYDNLGLTNGSNTRRNHVTAATERSATSGAWADVTGASFSLTVATNSVTLVALTCSSKSSATTNSCFIRVVGGSGNVVTGQYYKTSGNNAPALIIADGASLGANTYDQYAVMGSIHSAVSGTGSQTFKVQIALGGGSGTAYIKDIYLTAFNLTY